MGAMKAMKAKAMGAAGTMTVSGGYAAVAASNELNPKVVRSIITGYMELAASELKKNGSFKIAGLLNMKLKKKPARPARKGVNPFTKEPCVFKTSASTSTGSTSSSSSNRSSSSSSSSSS